MSEVTNIADKRKAKAQAESEVKPDEMSEADWQKLQTFNKRKQERMKKDRIKENEQVKRSYRLRKNDPNNKR